MTPKARASYFGHLWPEACLANEWDVQNAAQRRAVTRECMRLIRGPATDSTSKLGEAEITALFVYLRHLGDPASLEKSAEWVSCQDDYKTFALARNADWHERELYGKGTNKLDRNRFKGRKTAAGGPLETLDPAETKKRHLTFASRHQKKLRAEKNFGAKLDDTPSPVLTERRVSTTTESPVQRSGCTGLKTEIPF